MSGVSDGGLSDVSAFAHAAERAHEDRVERGMAETGPPRALYGGWVLQAGLFESYVSAPPSPPACADGSSTPPNDDRPSSPPIDDRPSTPSDCPGLGHRSFLPSNSDSDSDSGEVFGNDVCKPGQEYLFKPIPPASPSPPSLPPSPPLEEGSSTTPQRPAAASALVASPVTPRTVTIVGPAPRRTFRLDPEGLGEVLHTRASLVEELQGKVATLQAGLVLIHNECERLLRLGAYTLCVTREPTRCPPPSSHPSPHPNPD